MSRREAVEAALAEWRAAERLQAIAAPGDRAAQTREVEQHRADFQRLSAAHMAEWIDKLQEAETRRANATPSTPPFHEAARDAEVIAAEIWDTVRSSDEDTPQTAANQRTAPKRTEPGPSAVGID
jgi:acetoin utilization deacetylase AcuC-like enzyme